VTETDILCVFLQTFLRKAHISEICLKITLVFQVQLNSSKDNIKMDHLKGNGANWINLVQDRGQGRSLGNTVTTLPVP
jgi:hypothetical protein